MEIDARVKIIAIIFIFLFIISGIPFKILKDTISPQKEINNTPNITVMTVTKYIEILVTPTIDGKQYFASEYQTGLRKINNWFSYYREDALGKQDMNIHVIVYDYKIFNKYTWFNPQDWKYYVEFPHEGKKFIFVFINIYMDDVIADDTRAWFPDESHFAVQINNKLYLPIPIEKELKIEELKYSYNYNKDTIAQYYGTYRYYSSDLSHAKTAGETYENLTYIKGGLSNAISGYLLFEIPKDIPDEDLIVTGSFNAFGNSGWLLKPENNY